MGRDDITRGDDVKACPQCGKVVSRQCWHQGAVPSVWMHRTAATILRGKLRDELYGRIEALKDNDRNYA